MSLRRILDYLDHIEEAVVDEVRPVPPGVALLTPSLPLVWQLNALRVEDTTAGPADLVEEADRVFGDLGHRKLVAHDAELGRRLIRPLTTTGWNVFRLLVMVRDRPAERRVAEKSGAEVDRRAGAAGLAAFRREQPFGWQEEAVNQLAAMDERFDRAAAARDFGSPVNDPACVCRLYSANGVAQVDEVGTVEARRGRGHASAAVLAAVDAAVGEGYDPIFLLTDAADWPQHWYRTLGFTEVGSVYEFLKLPAGSTRP
jgi:ribosomal protein S18 acetylase RimI-like enzyme